MTKLLVAAPCKASVMESLQTEFSDRYQIIFAQGDADIIAQALPDAEVVIGEPAPALLQTAAKLKWMQITWAGADRFTRDFPANVVLTNTSGAFGRIISEYTLGMILSQYKHLQQYYINQHKHIWADLGPERSLLNQKVLILGTGNVGSNIAQKLHAFGTYNIGINRSGNQAAHFDAIYKLEELDRYLPEADIVIGALPRTSGTIGLLNYERMHKMKKDALLVNVGRGTMIVTRDLEQLLDEDFFCGVILDVVDPEPLPETSVLWTHPRVLLTPHISGIGFGHDDATEAHIWNICRENLRRYAAGEALNHIVDVSAGY